VGVLNELGIGAPKSNAAQRTIQYLAASTPGAWLSSKFLHGVDKLLFRSSNGRVTATSLLAGLPVVMLTTTGRKSGQPRKTPLLGISSGENVAIIGSNFGQELAPGWVYNLESNPVATLAYGNNEVTVTARRADKAETDATFEIATRVYPGYGRYRARADHREIRVMVLELDR